jgi:hypothetical protein
MVRRLGLAAAGLLLFTAVGASAQQVYTGNVMRIDPGERVIVFNDGRMVRTSDNSTILVGKDHVTLGTLQPGTTVTIYSAQPVAYRNGRYIVISEAPPAAGVPAPGVAIVPAPSDTASASPRTSEAPAAVNAPLPGETVIAPSVTPHPEDAGDRWEHQMETQAP